MVFAFHWRTIITFNSIRRDWRLVRITNEVTNGPRSHARRHYATWICVLGLENAALAVELGLFTQLAKGPLTLEELRQRLGLHERSARDFLDALVALGMLKREQGKYANTPATDLYLDRGKPTYMGGMLEMMSARLFRFWADLTEGLKTGKPQNEAKHGGDLFDTLYSDPKRLEQFLSAMTGLSLGIAHAMAGKFPWSQYQVIRRHRRGPGRVAGRARADAQAPDRHRRRPAGRRTDLREVRRVAWIAGPAQVREARLFQGAASPKRTWSSWAISCTTGTCPRRRC